MKTALILSCLSLAGCVVAPIEPIPPPPQPQAKTRYVQELEKFRAEVGERRRVYPDDDKPVRTMQNCLSLFPRGTDAERLCLLRGMDRYIAHDTPPLAERYLRQDDQIAIQVPRLREAPVSPPPVAVQPYNSSALIPCHINPTPPCALVVTPQPIGPHNGAP